MPKQAFAKLSPSPTPLAENHASDSAQITARVSYTWIGDLGVRIP
jgi:hypothetical protein